jgi:hypothetical protein
MVPASALTAMSVIAMKARNRAALLEILPSNAQPEQSVGQQWHEFVRATVRLAVADDLPHYKGFPAVFGGNGRDGLLVMS